MSKPFDATLKNLIAAYPGDWLAALGVPFEGTPEVLSADLSTVTAAADTLIRVGDLVVHIDVESGPDDSLGRRMLLYNVLAHHHTGLPVRTFAVLLRSNAARAGLTDRVDYDGLAFRFGLVKVWELSAEDLLSGGIGLAPLAVLGKPPGGQSRAEALPGQVTRLARRAVVEAGDRVGEVMTSAAILAGMHVPPDLIFRVFEGAKTMIESSAYQFLEELATAKITRDLIIEQGTTKFGPPAPDQLAKLQANFDPVRLKRLAIRLMKVDSWAALLRGR